MTAQEAVPKIVIIYFLGNNVRGSVFTRDYTRK